MRNLTTKEKNEFALRRAKAYYHRIKAEDERMVAEQRRKKTKFRKSRADSTALDRARAWSVQQQQENSGSVSSSRSTTRRSIEPRAILRDQDEQVPVIRDRFVSPDRLQYQETDRSIQEESSFCSFTTRSTEPPRPVLLNNGNNALPVGRGRTTVTASPFVLMQPSQQERGRDPPSNTTGEDSVVTGARGAAPRTVIRSTITIDPPTEQRRRNPTDNNSNVDHLYGPHPPTPTQRESSQERLMRSIAEGDTLPPTSSTWYQSLRWWHMGLIAISCSLLGTAGTLVVLAFACMVVMGVGWWNGQAAAAAKLQSFLQDHPDTMFSRQQLEEWFPCHSTYHRWRACGRVLRWWDDEGAEYWQASREKNKNQ